NPALEAALGLQASQTIGRPAAEVLERWPQLAAGIAQGKEVEAELDAGEGASRRHYAISISPMPGREGLPAGCIVLLRDVTELQQLAAQFLQAQKMESIGRLAGGVAHDFNNLLTAITGHATFARDALPSEHPARRDVEQVLKGARRAAQLTHQLLAFSRRQAMAPRPANLNDTILDMAEMLGHLIGEDVELAIDPASDLAAVCVDPNQLEQAIINLALNARDAMPDGGTLAIRTVNVAIDRHASGKLAGLAPGRYVALTVADTGTGLSPEAEAHLFEPFFTTKEIGEGTGLGLATVFGIVHQHQGRIVATSAPGQGTTFTIYLPSAPSEAAHAEPAQHEAPCDLPRGSECVLLVEDDPDVRAWAARALRELGYALYEAENGAAALALLERQPDLRPDLLVTDVVMPQMTGKALAARLRATYTALPVLFISGYTSSAVTDHEAGQAFLPKPFTQAALAGRVRDLLDGLD
ncbi:MAG TPA: ATP-binding protein, partial [Anaerolineae bacterium]|nr:ATP-binding protein [Anaerolineae bacterium]